MVKYFWIAVAIAAYFFFKKGFLNAPFAIKCAFGNKMRFSKYSALTDYWMIVANFESNDWKSGLCRNFNNLVGMRPSKVRKHCQSGETSDNFAIYNSYDDAVQDLIYFMDSWRYPTSFPDFRQFIEFMQSKGFCPELTAAEYYKRAIAQAQK